MGNDDTPHELVTAASTRDFVAGFVRSQPEPVVLVGHSMGGRVISEVADIAPDRIAGLVYVTALLPLSGSEDRLQQLPAGQHTALSADGLSATYDPAAAAEILYNTTDAAEARDAIRRLDPQPIAAMMDPIIVSEERFGRVRRAFIECTEDRAIPLAFQRLMLAARPCDPVFTLETDHSPFLSAPVALADRLLSIAGVFTGG